MPTALLSRLLIVPLAIVSLGSPVFAQEVARGQHGVDQPAIGEGLWISNGIESIHRPQNQRHHRNPPEITLPPNGAAAFDISAGGGDTRFTLVINKSQRETPILIETHPK